MGFKEIKLKDPGPGISASMYADEKSGYFFILISDINSKKISISLYNVDGRDTSDIGKKLAKIFSEEYSQQYTIVDEDDANFPYKCDVRIGKNNDNKK